jgi:hypothetical protein
VHLRELPIERARIEDARAPSLDLEDLGHARVSSVVRDAAPRSAEVAVARIRFKQRVW